MRDDSVTDAQQQIEEYEAAMMQRGELTFQDVKLQFSSQLRVDEEAHVWVVTPATRFKCTTKSNFDK